MFFSSYCIIWAAHVSAGRFNAISRPVDAIVRETDVVDSLWMLECKCCFQRCNILVGIFCISYTSERTA